MRCVVVCFFGCDGSGKSTLAGLLSRYLSDCTGKQSVVVWVRGTHTFSSFLARFMEGFQLFKGNCNPYYNICVPEKMSYLWVWLEFFSALPVFFARFVLPRITGRVVVAERCPVDFLVWLAVTLRRNVFKSFIGRATLSIAFSLCECMVYVRADEGVLLSRRSALWDRRVIPVELRIYDSLARFLGVRVVDTSGKSVEESLREVVEIAGNECV